MIDLIAYTSIDDKFGCLPDSKQPEGETPLACAFGLAAIDVAESEVGGTSQGYFFSLAPLAPQRREASPSPPTYINQTSPQVRNCVKGRSHFFGVVTRRRPDAQVNPPKENSTGVRALAYKLCRVGAVAVRCWRVSSSTFEEGLSSQEVKRGVGTRLSLGRLDNPTRLFFAQTDPRCGAMQVWTYRD